MSALIVFVTVGLAASGCGGKTATNGLEKLSAAEVQLKAATALKSAASAHVKGFSVVEGNPVGINLWFDGTSSSGTVTAEGARIANTSSAHAAPLLTPTSRSTCPTAGRVAASSTTDRARLTARPTTSFPAVSGDQRRTIVNRRLAVASGCRPRPRDGTEAVAAGAQSPSGNAPAEAQVVDPGEPGMHEPAACEATGGSGWRGGCLRSRAPAAADAPAGTGTLHGEGDGRRRGEPIRDPRPADARGARCSPRRTCAGSA